jgi:hypothetical protein
MKVRITFEFGERDRRAVANHYGLPGLATYETLKGFVEAQLNGVLEDVLFDLQRAEEDE